MGGVYSQIDLFGWTRNYEWPVFDRSVQAFLDARTGIENHRQKENGEYHEGIDSWTDQYLSDLKASTNLWTKFTGIFVHDLVVIGSICSVILFLGLFFSTLWMAITLCRRKGEELRRLGIMKALNFICCSSGSFLRELLDARARQAGFLSENERELDEFIQEEHTNRPIIRGTQLISTPSNDTDSWNSNNPPRYCTVDSRREETTFVSRQPSTGRPRHVDYLTGPIDHTRLTALPRSQTSAPRRQAETSPGPHLSSRQLEHHSPQPTTEEGQLMTYQQPVTTTQVVSSSAPDKQQLYQRVKQLAL